MTCQRRLKGSIGKMGGSYRAGKILWRIEMGGKKARTNSSSRSRSMRRPLRRLEIPVTLLHFANHGADEM